LKGEYPDFITADALIIRAKLNLAGEKNRNALEDLLLSTSLRKNQAHIREAERIMQSAGVILSPEELSELAGRYSESALLEILLKMHHGHSDRHTQVAGEILPGYFRADSLRRGSYQSPFKVGIISPLSGKYAALGRSFVRGAYVALKEGRDKGISNIDLVVADTKASALESHLVTRKLTSEENVDIILGGISNSSTVAAAQVAQANRTVIFSPVSNLEGIDAIGDYVFQTTVDYEAEVIALARVAVRELGLERIAFLAADSRVNREMELMFRKEVEREGGIICLADYYQEGSTDFKENIDRIRSSAPEALFIPADRNDLVLIMPQLSFYEFGLQLLGLSMWDSSNLIYMSGKDMSGAVFPGETRQNHQRELYLSAAALVNEPVENVNNFEVRGYQGMRKIIDALYMGFGENSTVRDRMRRLLNRRAHPFVRAAGNEGITFYTVRNGEKEEFLTYKFSLPRKK
ncbi:MAG: ABC transporter substrate-binding protein, partial [Candidatus Latescibacteria bacterium]|nr:ABC transporter substrate-binding protein [bacterium]MBD3423588.1 ABC transporter substrate-binding protein [Candidatus Latescibacterota bacterium]